MFNALRTDVQAMLDEDFSEAATHLQVPHPVVSDEANHARGALLHALLSDVCKKPSSQTQLIVAYRKAWRAELGLRPLSSR